MKHLAAIFIYLLSFSFGLDAQVSKKGVPASFGVHFKSFSALPAYQLAPVNIANELAADSAQAIPNRYAVVEQVGIDLLRQGAVQLMSGGVKITRYRFDAEHATSIGLFFTRFIIPDGARVFVYSPSGGAFLGAYTSDNCKPDSTFAIAGIKGGSVVVEYDEPANTDATSELVIGAVVKAYKEAAVTPSPGDVNCPQWADWQMQKMSVCRIAFFSGTSAYVCSGALINNVRNDGTRYFLTANHCLSSATVASTVIAYFNYEAPVCGGAPNDLSQSISGAKLCATNATSDVTLLKFFEVPPAEYNPFYAGWDATGKLFATGTCIHHPYGNPKVAVQSTSLPSSFSSSIDWDEGGSSAPNTHWAVGFNNSNIQKGSSGAPIFDQNKRITGQLHGSGGVTSFFGKLSVSFKNGTKMSERLAEWLDPDGTGTLVLDGYSEKFVPLPAFSAYPHKACVNGNVLFTDASKYKPLGWKWSAIPNAYYFVNGTTDTSQNPQIAFTKEGKYAIQLTASNANGADSIVENDFIEVRNFIDVYFNQYPLDTSVCGYDIANAVITATGATQYEYSLDSTRIFQQQAGNALGLRLNPASIADSTFTENIIVKGTHGQCVDYDTLRLKVVIPHNNTPQTASLLRLGENGPFSNACATAETNEPAPATTFCEGDKSWCPDNSSFYTVNKSLWFQLTAPSNGRITVDSRGFNTRLCLYKAASVDNLMSGNAGDYEIIAANDDRNYSDNQALLKNVAVEPFQKYWLQLDGYKGDEGNCFIYLYSNSVEVYPNPCADAATIIISTESAASARIALYSLTGQLVLNTTVQVSPLHNTFVLDVGALPSGMYRMLVQLPAQTLDNKVLIIKNKR